MFFSELFTERFFREPNMVLLWQEKKPLRTFIFILHSKNIHIKNFIN